MQVVDFYRGERGNSAGSMLESIMRWDNGVLEMDHDWVQWVFPSNEPSACNCDAPVLTQQESIIFQADPELRQKMKDSFIRVLDFLGMELVRDDEIKQIGLLEATKERPYPQLWMVDFNHTMLRITRILKSLRLTGLTEYAVAFYNVLREHKEKFSANTFGHWTRAIMDPLWPHEGLDVELKEAAKWLEVGVLAPITGSQGSLDDFYAETELVAQDGENVQEEIVVAEEVGDGEASEPEVEAAEDVS